MTELPEKLSVFRRINVAAGNSLRSVYTRFGAPTRGARFLPGSLREFAKLNRREIRPMPRPRIGNEHKMRQTASLSNGAAESDTELMLEITVACIWKYKLDLRTCRIGPSYNARQSFIKHRNIETTIENSFTAVELYAFSQRRERCGELFCRRLFHLAN